MGLFSFLKKKKPEAKIPTPPGPPGAVPKPVFPSPRPAEAGKPPVPSPKPVFPGMPSPKPGEKKEMPAPSRGEVKAPRQVDDFGIPTKEEFELPEIEVPKFKFPTKEEKAEVKEAIEKAAPKEIPKPEMKPKEEPKKEPEEVPEELPGLGEKAEAPEFEIPKGMEEPAELRELPKAKGPVYMRGDNFMSIKKGLSSMKENLKNMEGIFADITEIKNKQEADADVWHSSIEAVQRKLVYMDKTLFEK